MKVKFVDGFKLRNTIDPNFGGHFTSEYAPYIPPDEVWIEDYLRPEEEFFLKLFKTEQELYAQKKTFAEIRAHLQLEARKKGTPPDFYKHIIEQAGLVIAYVDGKIVREYLDPYFISGGHDLVYNYIPKNEVWIDNLNYTADQPFVLVHELFERDLMSKGRDYHSAHDFAIAEEKHHRRLAGVAEFITG
ncbi:MAG: hypothetical protein Q7S32_00010 [bacterium]|nr:hypothetical protein [bacterium]